MGCGQRSFNQGMTWYINRCSKNTDYKVIRMRHSILILWVIAVLGSGCGAKLPSMKPFKMEIQQGNVVTSKMLLQLRPGMTRSQVRYIMGTPLVVDSFRDNRWDYFYELRKQGVVVEKRRVILDFDKDSLVSVRGDVVPASENGESKTIAETPANTSPTTETKQESSWMDKLKFWSSEDAKTAQSTASKPAPTGADKPATNPPAQQLATPGDQRGAPAVAAVPVAPNAAATPKSDSKSAAITPPAGSDDEVIPYIPEGEYVPPVVPTEAEMVQGNLPETKQPVLDAQASSISQPGTAPAAKAASEASPTFMAEQLPEPEPVLPPVTAPAPVPQAAAVVPIEKPAAKPLAPVAAVLPAADSAEVAMTADESGVKQALAQWAQAWRSKSVKRYLAAYATDFVPENATSKTAWESQRKQRLSATPGSLTVELADLIIKQADGLAVAQFVQTYASKNYRDHTKKMLELRYEAAQQRWVITRERVLSAVDTAARPAPVVSAAPVTPPPAAPASAATSDTAAQAEVLQAVEDWAQAWRNKNITAYLAAYDDQFVPEGLPSKAAWEAQRKKRLAPQQGKISLEIAAISVTVNGELAEARFTQKYAAKSYRDEMQKRLSFKRDAATQRWRIVRETTANSANAAGVSQQVTAPEDSAEHLDGVLEQIGF